MSPQEPPPATAASQPSAGLRAAVGDLGRGQCFVAADCSSCAKAHGPTHTYTSVYIYIYIHTYMYIHMRMYIQCKNEYAHIHIYLYIHTYACRLMASSWLQSWLHQEAIRCPVAAAGALTASLSRIELGRHNLAVPCFECDGVQFCMQIGVSRNWGSYFEVLIGHIEGSGSIIECR